MTTDSLPPAVTRSVLKYRDYRLFLLARLLVTAAIQIQSVAVGYQVYELTSDPLQLGFVGLAQFLPMLALILPAGDLADRFNRRTILMLSCLLEAAGIGKGIEYALAGQVCADPGAQVTGIEIETGIAI